MTSRSIVQILAIIIVTAVSSLVLADEGYYKWRDVPPQFSPNNTETLAAASLFLTPRCSAVAISPDGYVLTALHCLEHCFTGPDSALDPALATVEQDGSKNQLYYIFSIHNQKPKDLLCPSIAKRDPSLGIPQVVATGRGYSYFDDLNAANYPGQVFDRILSTQDDFAILKFNPTHPLSCVRAALRPPRIGDMIWAVGYPRANTRPTGHFADGGQRVSYGHVYQGLASNSAYRDLSGLLADRLSQFYANDRMIISGMDIFSGDSGSMAVNSNGELVGINIAGAFPSMDEAATQFIDGSAVTLKLGYIRESLQQIAPEVAQQAFNCP